MKNRFRKGYVEVSDELDMKINIIKEVAQFLDSRFEECLTIKGKSEQGRCIALARTNLEQSIMWAVKGITYQEEDPTEDPFRL
jgi:hypothetical protein